jgi:hypothetical protein
MGVGVGLAVDGGSPPDLARNVGRKVGSVVPDDPPDGRDELGDVHVAEIHEAGIRLADQVDEGDLLGPVQDRRGRNRGLLTPGLRTSAHAEMVDHIDVISSPNSGKSSIGSRFASA